MRTPYPSDVTREQFEIIRPILQVARKVTRPRQVDLYEIFCAVLYLLKNASTWRALPHDFPNWKLVYYYFGIWSKKDKSGLSVLDHVLTKLENAARTTQERANSPSMIIVDSKTVQNADTAEEKGYDGAKKNGNKNSHRSRHTWQSICF